MAELEANKNPNIKLTHAMACKNLYQWYIIPPWQQRHRKYLITKNATMAKKKLPTGPANAVIIENKRGYLKLRWSIRHRICPSQYPKITKNAKPNKSNARMD